MTAMQYATATRFRLRFMLQEFELAPGRHPHRAQRGVPHHALRSAHLEAARAHPGDRRAAVLEDLGSRNGCRVNGAPLRGRHLLVAGDRIRVGKHEFVFGEFAPAASTSREKATGSLVFCAGCDCPYPGEMGMCPNCGSLQSLDEDTRSGVMNEQGKQVWAIDLLLEVFQKAVGSRRTEDAERVMRQVMSALETHLKNGSLVDEPRLLPISRRRHPALADAGRRLLGAMGRRLPRARRRPRPRRPRHRDRAVGHRRSHHRAAVEQRRKRPLGAAGSWVKAGATNIARSRRSAGCACKGSCRGSRCTCLRRRTSSDVFAARS